MKTSKDRQVSSGKPLRKCWKWLKPDCVIWQTNQVESSRPVVDDLDVLARISHRISYWSDIWCQRSNGCRTIQKVENVLIQSQQFHLLGKKKLQISETTIEVVLVDVTEQPIERPKKTTQAL
jgi:hypothetical protein